jgi:hypothetical protein
MIINALKHINTCLSKHDEKLIVPTNWCPGFSAFGNLHKFKIKEIVNVVQRNLTLNATVKCVIQRCPLSNQMPRKLKKKTVLDGRLF